jgi:tetratricopeptide (TPR) repeat protein
MPSGEIMNEKLQSIGARNPLSIIALFVFFIEAVATTSLKFVASYPQFARPLVWFIIIYPSVIALLFFLILWFKREILFGPMDFRTDESFSRLLTKFELRQQAAQVGPDTGLDEILHTVDELLTVGDIHTAVSVGRTFLMKRNFDKSLEVFLYIQKKVKSSHPKYYKILANIAYSQIGKKQFTKAIENLNEVRKIDDGQHFMAWHAVALAYCYYCEGDQPGYRHWLAEAKAKPELMWDIQFFRSLYPEIANDLALSNTANA